MNYRIIYLLSLLAIFSCESEQKNEKLSLEKTSSQLKRFELVDPNQSGLKFFNEVIENEKLNIFSYEYLYNGSGVAVGDINNDSLPDIFLGGNYFGGRLFLNKGNLKFEQISEKAGVFVNGFTTGVSMIDINNDGWLDIYLCRSVSEKDEERENVLLINNKNGTFTNRAKEYGLNDNSFSQQAYFFDYDNDGDIDMFLLNHRIDIQNALTLGYEKYRTQREKAFTFSKLFENNGQNKFIDITHKSGILNSTYALAASVSDFNNDGFKDIYISSDYGDKDKLFLNKNGKFKEDIDAEMFHISKNSMGNDAADINNDGFIDLITLDMMSESNYRQKQLKGQSPYDLFHLAKSYGLNYQVMRNCLQLNNGNGTFSEIGQLAGVSHTDWSWAPLFADFDNDGLKDLYITNGYFRDVTDMDFIKYTNKNTKTEKERFELSKTVKQTPTSNYLYKNNGNLTFSDVSKEWGLDKLSFSNGAVYVDLDLDGDLEIITNNFNEPAQLFKNNSQELENNNYIDFVSKNIKNVPGIGVKVIIETESGLQMQENFSNRGFLSCVDSKIHFGLGKTIKIKKATIVWNNSKMEVLENLQSNKVYLIEEKNATKKYTDPFSEKSNINFTTAKTLINYIHSENNFIDFKQEPLMEWMYSDLGPCYAKADVNGDNIEDIFIGGSATFSSKLFISTPQGMREKNNNDFLIDKDCEDVAASFFDIDGDKDLDLFVCSGSNEPLPDDKLINRIYLNDRKGNFSKTQVQFPSMNSSCVLPIDFDADGDEDIFIGGGFKAGNYPFTYPSKLLENKKGKLFDASSKLPNNGDLGNISCAEKFSQGKRIVIAGHWNNIRILKYENNQFKIEKAPELNSNYGWWNCIKIDDVDGNGEEDIILGNRGQNSFYKASAEFPAKLIYADFDNNGSIDAIPSYYFKDKVLYPKHTQDELTAQLPMIRNVYTRYEKFSNSTLQQFITDNNLSNHKSNTATEFSSCIFYCKSGNYKKQVLPINCQFSPINDFLVFDFDSDGHKDMIAIGNKFNVDVETGRHDASIGVFLHNNPVNRDLKVVQPSHNNLKITGDARKIFQVGTTIVVLINNSSPLFLNYKSKTNSAH